MCGCSSRATVSASARNRLVKAAPASERIDLIATSRPNRRSRASRTTPMPPRPSSRTTSYLSARAAGSGSGRREPWAASSSQSGAAGGGVRGAGGSRTASSSGGTAARAAPGAGKRGGRDVGVIVPRTPEPRISAVRCCPVSPWYGTAYDCGSAQSVTGCARRRREESSWGPRGGGAGRSCRPTGQSTSRRQPITNRAVAAAVASDGILPGLGNSGVARGTSRDIREPSA
jgi:hypothetical protein